jgi:hypothetical protein
MKYQAKNKQWYYQQRDNIAAAQSAQQAVRMTREKTTV